MGYFKDLLYDKRPHIYNPVPGDYPPMWDNPVENKEVDAALYKAKKGKSVGLDSINTELVIEFHKIYPDFLPNLFSNILQSGTFPES